jgi:hypothetical protein
MPSSAPEAEAESTLSGDRDALGPTGPGRRPRPAPQKLGGAVPVRFTAAMIEEIKAVAAAEGTSVSSWIRTEIEVALHRRKDADPSRTAKVIQLRPASAQRDVVEALGWLGRVDVG